MSTLLEKIDAENRKEETPVFAVGDAVKVHVRIQEGNNVRTQIFSGTVIARDGHGATETFTVRRISYGEGVEKVFPIHAPVVEKIEVEREGKVRRAKLYYARKLKGKKAKIT
ncbi:50S ribosomal protein L19 [Kiritimatiellota bacterium B12222]|nr:50S ribosomal protein L19 [Kiritimatiellota bacterium B12222]